MEQVTEVNMAVAAVVATEIATQVDIKDENPHTKSDTEAINLAKILYWWGTIHNELSSLNK